MNLSIGFVILGVALLIFGLIVYGATEKAALLAGVLIGIQFGSPIWLALCTWAGDDFYPDPIVDDDPYPSSDKEPSQ